MRARVPSGGCRSDGELVGRVRDGDRGAGDELCKRYQRKLRFYLLRKTYGRMEVAEDLEQEAFLTMLTAIKEGRLDNPDSVGGFLYSTCLHLAIRWREQDARQNGLDDTVDRVDEHRPDEPVIAQETRERVRDAFRRLRGVDKQVLSLRFYKGLSHRQIADQLGITEENARQRAKRALERLSDKLTPEDRFLVTFFL